MKLKHFSKKEWKAILTTILLTIGGGSLLSSMHHNNAHASNIDDNIENEYHTGDNDEQQGNNQFNYTNNDTQANTNQQAHFLKNPLAVHAVHYDTTTEQPQRIVNPNSQAPKVNKVLTRTTRQVTKKVAPKKVINNTYGSGSVKETPNVHNVWKPNYEPQDIQKYVHSPEAVGMQYGGKGTNWIKPGNNGTDFAISYAKRLWNLPQNRVMKGEGKNIAKQFQQTYKGKLYNTPRNGAIASTTNPNVERNKVTGHAYIVEHVFKDGDYLVVEQDEPSLKGVAHTGSGKAVNRANTWNYVLFPKRASKDTVFFVPAGKPQWTNSYDLFQNNGKVNTKSTKPKRTRRIRRSHRTHRRYNYGRRYGKRRATRRYRHYHNRYRYRK